MRYIPHVTLSISLTLVKEIYGESRRKQGFSDHIFDVEKQGADIEIPFDFGF